MAVCVPKQARCAFTRSIEINSEGGNITDSEQSITRPKSIRSCLSRSYFNGDELENDNILEALAQHAECWKDDEIDPSIAAAKVGRLVVMSTERTAVDRVIRWPATEVAV